MVVRIDLFLNKGTLLAGSGKVESSTRKGFSRRLIERLFSGRIPVRPCQMSGEFGWSVVRRLDRKYILGVREYLIW